MIKKYYLLIVALMFLASCANQTPYIYIEGFAQGTTWHITYKDCGYGNLKMQVDSILTVFDNSLSAYNKQSLLTRINQNDTTVIVDNFFSDIFDNSLYLYNISGKMFDPTVSPLVSLWGFTKHKDMHKPTQQQIDSVLEFVGLNKVTIENKRVVKQDPRLQLIFNANAQGYSVDIVSQWLETLGCNDYIVEIGGEVFAKGLNRSGIAWQVGIDSPIDGSTEENRVIQTIVPLTGGKSLCTSGNYRNYFVENGEKYSHELDPTTGYPKRDSLLSVAIEAPNAMLADGLATAVMVLGMQKGYKLVDSLPDVEGYFIYTSNNTLTTKSTTNFGK